MSSAVPVQDLLSWEVGKTVAAVAGVEAVASWERVEEWTWVGPRGVAGAASSHQAKSVVRSSLPVVVLASVRVYKTK